MAFEIQIGERLARIELHNRAGNKAIIEIDDRRYDVDIVEVEPGIYSIIYDGKSYNIELIEAESAKKYHVNNYRYSFELEIIDSESKYLRSREKGISEEAEKIISSPMPGKIVKIFVNPGDDVVIGQTVIVVEAMKMQNEYQSGKDTKVKEILVKEGDTVNAGQALIILE